MGFFSAHAPCLQDIKTMNVMENAFRRILPFMLALVMAVLVLPLHARPLTAQSTTPPLLEAAVQQHAGGEANLVIPDLSQVTFLGVKGTSLLMGGLIICALGLIFGL